MKKTGNYVIWEKPGESVTGILTGGIKQNHNGKPYVVLQDGRINHYVYINEYIEHVIGERDLYEEVVRITSNNGAGYLKIDQVAPDKLSQEPHPDWERRDELISTPQKTLNVQPQSASSDTSLQLKADLVKIYSSIRGGEYGHVPQMAMESLMDSILAVEEHIINKSQGGDI